MSKPEKLRVVIVEPGRYAHEAEIDNTLEAMQTVVGGWIDSIGPWLDDNAYLIINDVGKLIPLEPNRALPEYEDVVFGTFFLCGDGGEDFCSLTDAQVKGFDRVLRGIDWGYYPDPFAYNECHYDTARRTLYLFGEITARKLGNAQTAELVRARNREERITADSAEPKSIDDFRSAKLPCVAAKKGPGSVEHGMKWLQSLTAIVIDPKRCPDTLREFLEYEYERGRDGEIEGGYPDMGNHHIDAVRYALESVITRRVARVSSR